MSTKDQIFRLSQSEILGLTFDKAFHIALDGMELGPIYRRFFAEIMPKRPLLVSSHDFDLYFCDLDLKLKWNYKIFNDYGKIFYLYIDKKSEDKN
ncbi:hypothetical protein BpHYR1_038458 [Brachionus plicatilis]|uniref:Uncharacterized protein n=1 Tax=Brachionus plicatilis TaxID=10195 RepID=A0A3M7S8Z0_BRAPC|nr:hypothetical protein BpHYR1_038458 [Brachionus plicatilis]